MHCCFLSAGQEGEPSASSVDIIMERLRPDAPALTVEGVFGPAAARGEELPWKGAAVGADEGVDAVQHGETSGPPQAEGGGSQRDGKSVEEDSPDMLESEGDDDHADEDESEGDDEEEEERESEEEEGLPKTQEGRISASSSSSKKASRLSRLKEQGTVWVVPGGAMTERRRGVFIKHLEQAGYRASSTFEPESTVVAVMDPAVTCQQAARLAKISGDPAEQLQALPALCVECQTNCQDVIERLQQDPVVCDIVNVWKHLSGRSRGREEEEEEQQEEEGQAGRKGKKPRFEMKRKGYACVVGVKEQQQNLNDHLTVWFERLRDAAKLAHDTFRLRSYMKTVDILKAQPRPILTEEDAEKLGKIHGVGKKTVMRICHILRHGTLPLPEGPEEMMVADVLRVTSEFESKIWGVGKSNAFRLYKAGYRSMEDLALRGQKDLTRQQLIGLKHWRDLAKRIPREEVQLIEARVRAVVERVLPGASVTTCGSYRRGKADTGDVDILISPPRRENTAPLDRLMDIIVELRKESFLTDDLSLPSDRDKPENRPSKGGRPMNEYNNVQGTKGSYMGVCRVSEAHPHRRIDLKLYAADELPFALLYFTGSQYFNMSMRSWAINKKGVSGGEAHTCLCE